MQLIEKLVDFGEQAGERYVRQTQYIPDDFLSQLRNEKIESLHTPAGEFHRVAVIPTHIVDRWASEGFDIHREPAAEIIKHLRKEQLDGFITSNKL
jgi:hypothetical protein